MFNLNFILRGLTLSAFVFIFFMILVGLFSLFTGFIDLPLLGAYVISALILGFGAGALVGE